MSIDLPPYEPTPKPPSTPQEFVRHALELAARHDANNPAGQARFLESVGDMHLQQGRPETALLAYSSAEQLHRRAIGNRGDPMPLALFLGRAADQLRQYGQARAAAEFSRRREQVMFG